MKKRKILSVISVVLCLVSLFTMTGEAAARTNFGTYKDDYILTPDKTRLINFNFVNFCSTQGFGVGSKYLYSVKTNGDFKYAAIYRANKNGSTSDKQILRNAHTGKYYIYGLNHANDMCVTAVNNKTQLFIVTANYDTGYDYHDPNINYSVMRLEVSSDCYTIRARYKINIPNNNKAVDNFSGISILNESGNNIELILKNGEKIYKTTVGKYDTGTKSVEATKMFDIYRDKVKVAPNSSEPYTKDISKAECDAQGMDYCKKNDTLYFVLSGKARSFESIIITYPNVKASKSKTRYPSDNLTFFIPSKKYAALFEMEGCGVCSSDGKLYFNTNRRTSKDSTDHDMISYIKDYKAF